MKRKSLKRELVAQFYRENRAAFIVAVFASLATGTLNLIVSWILQQLIDTASGVSGALSLGTLAIVTGGFILLCAIFQLFCLASEPKFIARAMRNYKDFALVDCKIKLDT